MAEVIPFPGRTEPQSFEPEIDLLTAVDVAIRDLRDITMRWGEESALLQADECRRMLESVFSAALAAP